MANARQAVSLRSARPTTFYQNNADVHIPPAGAHAPASRQQARPAKLSKKAADARKSKVGANLKKRLSMRYAPIPVDAYGQAPPMPPLPAAGPAAPLQPGMVVQPGFGMTPGHGAAGYGEEKQGRHFDEAVVRQDREGAGRVDDAGGRRASVSAVDVDLLSKESFDPEAYLRLKLPDMDSETALRSLQQTLQQSKEATNTDLQRQVFKNYAEFITISKEIATLENNMLELKELLAEWKTVPHVLELNNTGGGLSDARGRRNNRSSILDLQAFYRAQITSLWESIEGCQKFLPYVPGRHLVAEASSFVELNAATYKPKQGVSLYLLDDMLLVAVRKKRQMSSKVRLVAERCFTLAEIAVIDVKDGGDLTNAIKVRRGKETFVYRSERFEDKKALLAACRKVAEELSNKRRKESLAEAEARKRESGIMSNGDGLVSSSSGSFKSSSASVGSRPGESGNELRWINDFVDDLSVRIALREWEEAVHMVEQGKARVASLPSSDPYHGDMETKLAARTADLVSAISLDLASPNLKKSAVCRNASFLLRLDQGEAAREIFLNARSEMLRRRARQIKFEGDVGLYISEFALVHFTLIKNTSEWYMSAFKDNKMASGFVRWATKQIEAYAEMFRRQVYGVDQDPRVIREAIQTSRDLAKPLTEVGLSFDHVLQELLQPPGVVRDAPPVLSITLANDDDRPPKERSERVPFQAAPIPRAQAIRASIMVSS